MTLLLPLLAAGVGAIAGSFIANLCLRWPRGESVVSGRSRCESCGSTLAARDLVPILSWTLNGGRCRSCGAAIDPLHWRVELAAASLAGAALFLMPGWGGAALALFWLLLLPSAVLDARHYWLPDSLTLATALAGLAIGGVVTGLALPDRLIGGLAAFAGLALVAALYRRLRGRDGLGAGDPKFFGAIGLWTGWQALAPILLVASLVGLAAALLMRRGRFARLPFGTLLAIAAILWTGMTAAAQGPAL